MYKSVQARMENENSHIIFCWKHIKKKRNKNADDNKDVDDNNIHQNLFPVKGKGCKIKAVIVSKM